MVNIQKNTKAAQKKPRVRVKKVKLSQGVSQALNQHDGLEIMTGKALCPQMTLDFPPIAQKNNTLKNITPTLNSRQTVKAQSHSEVDISDRKITMDERIKMIRTISRRLFILPVMLLIGIIVPNVWFPPTTGYYGPDPLIVISVGILGGFVGLQHRIKKISEEELILLHTSWFYTSLAPLIGGILALIMYIFFLSEFVNSNLFPKFLRDHDVLGPEYSENILTIFDTHCVYQDYAKLVFWSFFAGYSNQYAFGIITHFKPLVFNVKNKLKKFIIDYLNNPPSEG